MKLNLGCGRNQFEGFINVDCLAWPGVDVVWDLEKTPLPFESDSVEFVELNHVIEHVRNWRSLLVEIHRICKNGAVLHLKYPIGNVRFANPEHVNFWNEETLDLLCNFEYYQLPEFKLVSKQLNSDFRIAWLPFFARRILHLFTDRSFFELEASLEIVKLKAVKKGSF